jgi:signal transduction histidine kinase
MSLSERVKGAAMTNEEESDLVQIMCTELHEISQPLTTLRCRLELALMVSPRAKGREKVAPLEEGVSLHGAVEGALDDLRRVFVVVNRMRTIVLAKVSK